MTSRFPFSVSFAAVFAVAVFAPGCSNSDSGAGQGGDSDAETAGLEAQQVESDTETFGQQHVGSDAGGSLALAFAQLPAPSAGGLRPEGLSVGFDSSCFTLTKNSDTSYTESFNDCHGPLGLVHLTGTVQVTVAVTSPTEWVFNFSATDFQINHATVSNWQAKADVKADGTGRTLDWTASLSGTTRSGREFTRTNNKTLTWQAGGSCLGISGSSDGTISGHHLTTTVSSFNVCTDGCPKEGSEISIKNDDDGASFDIKYDGGARATVTVVGPRGNSATAEIGLFCGSAD